MNFEFLSHVPVLQKEVIQYLNPKPNENFIDCTFGMGGHTKLILEKIKPNGKVLGIEWDSELYKKILNQNIDRLILVNDSYVNLDKIVKEKNFGPVSGILFDLGMSSWHLEQSGRGFSFQKNEPLIMRYNWPNHLKQKNSKSSSLYSSELLEKKGLTAGDLTAGDIVNKWSEKEIERILREYGEERFSKRIASNIGKARKAKPIETTIQLNEIIRKSLPGKRPKTRIHPATRTFQALRIAVNQELENLEKTLPQALEILKIEGRLAIISFHSLEERIVKQFFKENKEKLKIITKKPIIPTNEELRGNPRSRCAKLRGAIKL